MSSLHQPSDELLVPPVDAIEHTDSHVRPDPFLRERRERAWARTSGNSAGPSLMTHVAILRALPTLFLNVDSLDRAPINCCLDACRHLVGYLPHTSVAADPVCLDDPACVVRVVFFKDFRAIDVIPIAV